LYQHPGPFRRSPLGAVGEDPGVAVRISPELAIGVIRKLDSNYTNLTQYCQVFLARHLSALGCPFLNDGDDAGGRPGLGEPARVRAGRGSPCRRLRCVRPSRSPSWGRPSSPTRLVSFSMDSLRGRTSV
jgi:hypothetical protein